jgi:hypothetical protein
MERMKTPEYNPSSRNPDSPEAGPLSSGDSQSVKKLYKKPAFRHERVFETRALSCGKVQTTQGACHANRKTS